MSAASCSHWAHRSRSPKARSEIEVYHSDHAPPTHSEDLANHNDDTPRKTLFAAAAKFMLRGEYTHGGRDRHGRLLTLAPSRIRRRDGPAPIEWMAAAPLHCGTCRKRAAHPAGDQLCLALVDPPGVSEFGVFTRFLRLVPLETGFWDSLPEGYAMIRVMAFMAQERNEFGISAWICLQLG